MKDSVIIFGINSYSLQIKNNLATAQINSIVCDNNKAKVEQYNEDFNSSAFYLTQNNLDILEKQDLSKVHAILINIDDDANKLIYAINIKKKYPNLKIIAAIENTDLKQSFYNAGVIYTLSKEEITAKITASFLFEKDVAIYLDDLCRYSERPEEYDIIQYKLKENSKALKMKYNDLFFFLKQECNIILIGLSRFDKKTQKDELFKNPSTNLNISIGDDLILICNNESRDNIEKYI